MPINTVLKLRNVPMLDAQTISLDGAEVLTGAVPATINGDYINIGASQDQASNNGLQFTFLGDGFTSGGAAVVTYQVEADADGSGSGTVIVASQAYAYGSVPKVVHLPLQPTTTHKYYRANVVVSGVALTAGSVKAGLTRNTA